MHHAVEMVLARMESHPEDFSQERSGKWLQVINAYKKFFTEEEGTAVRDGLRKINMDSMAEDIMKRMVKDEEPKGLDGLAGWLEPENPPRQPTQILTTSSMIEAASKILTAELSKGITKLEEENPFKLETYSVGFTIEPEGRK